MSLAEPPGAPAPPEAPADAEPARTAAVPVRTARMVHNLAASMAKLRESGQYDVETVLADAARRGVGPLRALADAGVPHRLLQRAVWQHRGYPLVSLTTSSVAMGLFEQLPLEVCEARGVVPYDGYGSATVAVSDPTDIAVIDELRGRLGPDARFVVAEATDIRRVLQSVGAQATSAGLTLEGVGEDRSRIVDIEQFGASEGEVAQLVNSLVVQAASSFASDVHIEPSLDSMDVRFRIDGVLHHMTRYPASVTPGVVNRLKVLANLDVADRRRPQDGRFGVAMGDTRLDLRLVTLPTIWEMEGAVIRILDQSQQVSELEGLGFSPWVLEAYSRLCLHRHGSVLATGPTGSGKTTTLYATLARIATSETKVLAVEDPVEIRFPDATQVQVNVRAGLTFATALRSFVRADPDIILVGEVRDLETALVSTEAALTGHLVLASLHANNAPAAATRLLEMGIDAYLVASSLRGVVSQRLLRRLCGDCRVPDMLQPELFEHLVHLEPMPAEIFRAREGGCGTCSGIGYRGRTAVAEVVEMDEEMSAAIAASRPGTELMDLAVAAGMVPMRDDGLVRVMQGQTSVSEVARVVN